MLDERFFMGVCFIAFMVGVAMACILLIVTVFNQVNMYVFIVILLTVGVMTVFCLYMAIDIMKILYNEYY